MGFGQRARADETLEPSALGVHLAPAFGGKLDHRETSGRQSFIEAFAGLDITRGDQQPRDVVQAGIVTDDQEGTHRRRGCLHDRHDRLRSGIVETVFEGRRRRAGQSGGEALPGLPRATRRRHDDGVRSQRMTGDVGTDQLRIAPAARIETALVIAHAGLGLFRLGVSQQHQSHGTASISRGGQSIISITSVVTLTQEGQDFWDQDLWKKT
jgi:hypothetical protein